MFNSAIYTRVQTIKNKVCSIMKGIDEIPKYEKETPVTSPPPDHFQSVSIVANSGKLKGSKLGKEIDKKDGVIRMNAAPVKGYEEDVGKKTSFRFVNGLLQKGKTLDYIDTPKNWLKTVKNENLILMPLGERSRNKAKKMIDDSNTLYIFKNDFKHYFESIIKSKIGKVPSTGILSTLFAMQIAEKIYLYGFGFHQEDLENRHYYEDWDDSHNASHNWLTEKNFLEKLEKENKNITIHKT